MGGNRFRPYKIKKYGKPVGADSISAPNGITLIALIITIIIMLILAGIVLTMTIGENGIIRKAILAKNKWENATSLEENELEKLYEYMGEDLPENTKDTEAGTMVKIPDKWKTNTPYYVSTENGETVVKSKQIATVQAVATGNGETVPVPIGFYYVGGNLSTGVVISDNQADQNKYVNAEEGKVPSGVKVENGRFVDELQGNQFVWIPCTVEEYTKYNWGQGNVSGKSNCYWGTETSHGEKLQIEKYGGFYVGRFEASLPQGTQEFTGSVDDTSDIYNFEGVPQSKAGRSPWNFVDWNKSVANSEAMYKNHSTVSSGLISDTMWDVMIRKIESTEGKSLTDSKTWGNYYSGESFTFTGRTSQYASTQYAFGDIQENATKTNKTYYLLSSGASDHNRAYNLYDVAGNLWECTEESVSSYNSVSTHSTNRMFRGGSFYNGSTTAPACLRNGSHTTSGTFHSVGFRVVLYMK